MSRSESIPSIHEYICVFLARAVGCNAILSKRELAAEVAHETLGSQVDSQPFPALLSPQQQPSNGASFVEYNDTQSLHPSELRARSTSMTSHHAENRMSRSIKLITGDLVTGTRSAVCLLTDLGCGCGGGSRRVLSTPHQRQRGQTSVYQLERRPDALARLAKLL